MIYGDTTSSGELFWLTQGAAQIAPWRNGLAMLHSGISGNHFLRNRVILHRKIYSRGEGAQVISLSECIWHYSMDVPASFLYHDTLPLQLDDK